jgi:hypothetical protein
MDCEKFDSTLMDELYGELDELTSAAAKRHIAGCARCSALIGGMRATRRLASVPLVDPPADLEERILAAAKDAQKVVPIGRRVARIVSLAGGWAMRPQTAMAAVFLVMIGTSVLLLHGRSAKAPVSSSVRVTDEGAPAPVAASASPMSETAAANAAAASATSTWASGEIKGGDGKDRPTVAATPPTASPYGDLPMDESLARRAKKEVGKDKDDSRDLDGIGEANASTPGGAPQPSPIAMGAGGAPPPPPAVAQSQAGPAATATAANKAPSTPFDTAMQAYRAGRWDDAAKGFDALSANDPNADLMTARAIRQGKGCRAAVARFDSLSRRVAGTSAAWDALLEGGICYEQMGKSDEARVRFTSLLNVDSHKDRAQAELDKMNAVASRKSAVGPQAGGRAAPAPASKPAASAADSSGF